MGKHLKVMEEHNIPYIPNDILVNILKRLGVKSLIRFQCVCKDWKNLIKSPSFIQDHLHHSTHQNPLLLLSWIYHSMSSFRDKRTGVLDLHNKPALKIQKPPLIDSSFEIVASSNGLVCVYADDKFLLPLPHYPKKKGTAPPYLLLWNPATRQFKKVPRTTREFNRNYCLGFGFTPIDNDYKIVRIYDDQSDSFVNQVEVYSLNSGSWKEIELENLEGTNIISSRFGNVVVNGVMYWLGRTRNDAVLIDLSRQVCTSIPLPHLKDHYVTKSLVVYENKLALVAGNRFNLIYLWVMEEDTCESRRRWILTVKRTDSPCAMDLALIPSAAIWRNKIVFPPFYFFEDDYERQRLCMLHVTTNEFQIRRLVPE